MRMSRMIKQKGGFTLVELLVSITLFGILIIAFLTIFSGALRATVRAGNRDKTLAGASGIVENKMASPGAVTPEPDPAIIVYGDPGASTTEVPVYKITGTSDLDDGTVVTVEYYKTVT